MRVSPGLRLEGLEGAGESVFLEESFDGFQKITHSN